jgi:hypothetical protein
MARWEQFAEREPRLSEAGRALFYQYGPGLGFLATVRADGGPRMHPICPVIAEGGLYAFIVPSPKRGDLARDGRFAMHSFPAEATDDEFYIAGKAAPEADAAVRAAVADAYHDDAKDEWRLFHFDIERALLSTYRFRGDWPPVYSKWSESREG